MKKKRKVGRPRIPVETRLVRIGWDVGPTGCWIWRGAKKPTGYGFLGVTKENGRKSTVGAHVVSYQHHIGPVPDGMFVLHRCDNPPCVNPRHLWIGTQRDNMRDMVQKGRGSWQRTT